MSKLDFSLASTQEIIKELAKRAKQKRKRDIQYFGDQKKFAKHIGMTHRRYQQFEITGKITLEKFIDVLRGLNALDKIQELLEIEDEELFKKENHRKNSRKSSLKKDTNLSKIKKDNDVIYVPDVFS